MAAIIEKKNMSEGFCNWYNKIHRFWPIKIQCFRSVNLPCGILPLGGEGKDEELENVF